MPKRKDEGHSRPEPHKSKQKCKKGEVAEERTAGKDEARKEVVLDMRFPPQPKREIKLDPKNAPEAANPYEGSSSRPGAGNPDLQTWLRGLPNDKPPATGKKGRKKPK